MQTRPKRSSCRLDCLVPASKHSVLAWSPLCSSKDLPVQMTTVCLDLRTSTLSQAHSVQATDALVESSPSGDLKRDRKALPTHVHSSVSRKWYMLDPPSCQRLLKSKQLSSSSPDSSQFSRLKPRRPPILCREGSQILSLWTRGCWTCLMCVGYLSKAAWLFKGLPSP